MKVKMTSNIEERFMAAPNVWAESGILPIQHTKGFPYTPFIWNKEGKP
jgi:hypothetical protein